MRGERPCPPRTIYLISMHVSRSRLAMVYAGAMVYGLWTILYSRYRSVPPLSRAPIPWLLLSNGTNSTVLADPAVLAYYWHSAIRMRPAMPRPPRPCNYHVLISASFACDHARIHTRRMQQPCSC